MSPTFRTEPTSVRAFDAHSYSQPILCALSTPCTRESHPAAPSCTVRTLSSLHFLGHFLSRDVSVQAPSPTIHAPSSFRRRFCLRLGADLAAAAHFTISPYPKADSCRRIRLSDRYQSSDHSRERRAFFIQWRCDSIILLLEEDSSCLGLFGWPSVAANLRVG